MSAQTNGRNPTRQVTGQFIARATVNYPSWQRALDAVRWTRGELQIKPTVKQAAEIFGVNAPQMKVARERLEHFKRHAANGNGATALSNGRSNGRAETLAEHIARSSPTERLAAARIIGPAELWDSMISPVVSEEQGVMS